MFYISNKYEDNLYGVTDTKDLVEKIYSASEIISIIKDTGVKSKGYRLMVSE